MGELCPWEWIDSIQVEPAWIVDVSVYPDSSSSFPLSWDVRRLGVHGPEVGALALGHGASTPVTDFSVLEG